MKKKPLCLCEYCIEAIRSRGEKLRIVDHVYTDDEEPIVCDWCGEETEEYYECEI